MYAFLVWLGEARLWHIVSKRAHFKNNLSKYIAPPPMRISHKYAKYIYRYCHLYLYCDARKIEIFQIHAWIRSQQGLAYGYADAGCAHTMCISVWMRRSHARFKTYILSSINRQPHTMLCAIIIIINGMSDSGAPFDFFVPENCENLSSPSGWIMG